MRITVSDGVELEAVVAGDGPLLVLVHGFSGAKEDFTEHLEALADGRRVVAFDHRGHGESDQPASGTAYSIERLARDVVEVAEALGESRFDLLGHSLGGMVAQTVVLREPERVRSLVLMNTGPGPPPGVSRDDVRKAGEIALARGMDALRRLMDGADAMATPAHERLLRERPGYQEFGDRKFLAQSPHAYAALAGEIVDRADVTDRLREVACPTLVVVGDEDARFVPGSRRLADVIPGARLVRLPGAGHNPQFEQPGAWIDAVTRFLASRPAEGSAGAEE